MAEGEFALVKQHLEMALQKHSANFVNVFNNSSWAGDHDLYAMLADSAAQQQDEAALRQFAPLAEALAVRYGHMLYQAIAHRAWGVAHRLAGEYDAAEARLQQALDLFTQLETRWQMARTLAESGELESARADPERARNYFSRALSIFEDLKALPDAARTRAALETLGPVEAEVTPQLYGEVVPHSSVASPSVGDGALTRREIEVLHWLARGLSNAEIAARLTISPRTVSAHLRSIFAKLDVTTRTAAVRAALDLNIL